MGTQTASTFDGIVAFDQDKVPVTVSLDSNKVSLVAGDTDIGEWSTSECVITDEGAGEWLIEAEEDKLSFFPGEPGRFAHSLEANGVPASQPKPQPEAVNETAPVDEPGSDAGPDSTIVEEAPQKTTAVVAFYGLAVLTAVLGIWALASLF